MTRLAAQKRVIEHGDTVEATQLEFNRLLDNAYPELLGPIQEPEEILYSEEPEEILYSEEIEVKDDKAPKEIATVRGKDSTGDHSSRNVYIAAGVTVAILGFIVYKNRNRV